MFVVRFSFCVLLGVSLAACTGHKSPSDPILLEQREAARNELLRRHEVNINGLTAVFEDMAKRLEKLEKKK